MAAQKLITLEDIWKNGTFTAQYVPGFNFMNDGKHYTRLESNKIQQYDLTNGNFVQTIFDASAVSAAGFNGRMQGYRFSADEQKILIWSEVESIYRHSTKEKYFVYDRDAETLAPVFDGGKYSLANFNPQGDKVAFVFENNLYVKDLQTDEITQVTNDGKKNHIINGGMDWVYEEEFALKTGYQWSPDGQRVAFYRFDESRVKEFTMTHYRDGLYPEYETFKYPKVGEENSIVTIHIYDTESDQTVQAATGNETDIYFPRIRWTKDPNTLCIFRLNRHQNHLELLAANAKTGDTEVFFSERNEYYITEATLDDFTFLTDGERFLFTSERDGWRHIYLGNMNGTKPQQLTKGKWEVSNLYGVDEARELVYYQAAEESPLERQVYALGLNGKNKRTLAGKKGTNSAQFSSNYDYYVVTHSTANSPATYTVYNNGGKQIRVIEDNNDLREKMKTYQTQPVGFFDFETSDKVRLNGWMIKPRGFNESRQYPVLMFVYGGPGSQQVREGWLGSRYWWFQMLAQQGFIVACVDNRGTGGRGEEFKKMTYLQLGKYETIDQIEAAKWLGDLDYVDANRIGIFGWSYGGYMSSLAILKGNDVFAAAIAVAPVTNWKWYDTIYTERYMRTEEENADGYRENSPVYFADRLKGEYLLMHGLGDDNVHFQHTAEMANALISANKQFDTYFYPNRNHGIYGDNARLHLYTKMTRFLQQKLKGADLNLQPTKAKKRINLIEKGKNH
jgi:dipeptidyl-peptidase-4